jgi:hypothetical protein
LAAKSAASGRFLLASVNRMVSQQIIAEQFEVIGADAPLSDAAIDAIADLLLAIDEEEEFEEP